LFSQPTETQKKRGTALFSSAPVEMVEFRLNINRQTNLYVIGLVARPGLAETQAFFVGVEY
jgi:hypothetical protein